MRTPVGFTRRASALIAGIFFLFAAGTEVAAQTQSEDAASSDDAGPAPESVSEAPAARPKPPRAAKKRAKRTTTKVKRPSGRAREKKTDGTRALNRFKGDPIIRSKYRLNGKPLEVDPD